LEYKISYIIKNDNEFRKCQKYLFLNGCVWNSTESEELVLINKIPEFYKRKIIIYVTTENRMLYGDDPYNGSITLIEFSTMMREDKLKRILNRNR